MLSGLNRVNGFQKRIKWLKIPNFMFYIVLFSMVLYFAEIMLRLTSKNMLLYSTLEFNKVAILKGEVWRIFSYVFLIPKIHIALAFLYVYVLNFVSNSLEVHWGASKLTAYYILGYILTTIVGFIGGSTNIVFLNLSLIFVFVVIYPDMSITLLSFINIKAVWLGSLNAILFLAKLIISLVIFNLSNLLAELVAIFMFILFFGPSYFINLFLSVKRFMKRQRF